MEAKEYSDDERLAWLWKTKEALEREGFRTTWRNPFFDWIGNVKPEDRTEELPGMDLYLVDPPVSRVAPFDFAVVRIRVQHDRGYFELEITFNPLELQQAREPEEFQDVWEGHDRDWLIKLQEYFSGLEWSYGLSWDVECDECITDSLYGNFSMDDQGIGRIIALMRDMKVLEKRETQQH